MRSTLTGLSLVGLALATSACGGNDQAATNNTHVEEMGPMGGSNVTTTPPANAGNAPVGATGDGNVAPGNADPRNPRPGMEAAGDNTQTVGNSD